MGSVLNFGWLAMPDAGWLWHMLAFIALWTAGLFTVQALTLVSPQDSTPRFARWAPRIRLLIDVCFTTAIAMFLPPVVLAMVSVMVFFAHLGLMAHFRYFLRPLSALTLYHNWREGAKASSHSVSARTRGLNLIFGASLLVKLTLLATMPAPGVGRGVLWGVGAVAAVGYVGLMVLVSWNDPLDKILTTRGIGRLGMVRGYFVTWLAEFYYLGKRQVLESAIRQQQITSDALTPVEGSIPIRRQLVVIQAESL
ncbi:MAG TPA: hypothetical protein VG056_05520, partial [Pirellulales bacterium]|nr:hypothetical protein [Pirellulales bacterium]